MMTRNKRLLLMRGFGTLTTERSDAWQRRGHLSEMVVGAEHDPIVAAVDVEQHGRRVVGGRSRINH